MKAVFIPNGPKNLSSIFPSLNFEDVEEYSVELHENNDALIASSTTNVMRGCDEDKIRIHFLNYAGSIDAINFRLISKEHDPKSESYETPVTYPLEKTAHAVNRFNVKSSDTWLCKSVEYTEEDMQWINELLDSPAAWIEWKGTQGQADSYLPILIVDQKTVSLKEADRYTYEVSLQFKMSHETFILRN